ncbi:TKL protein kinase [Salpingoeca rosetta]|uniref:TKL protein kinase n=1 Tax=Salpingoeca rosetta (strain ATCC 50818 / BSB-021) TaxID=946362 RepID=F2UKE6_SALR5|nr:TKL protein kinase [Salpingoeca rosetta]EGD77595.1 TKL protein kinase [Salpingoeca rosetta]|eukprot:XP_004990483.1 TKL protein kinase [Salpingoeca rosetta]
MRGATTTAVVMLLVMLLVVVSIVAATPASISSISAATRTEPPTQEGQDNQLCLEVHGTLDSMVRILKAYSVPFFSGHSDRSGSNNDATTANATKEDTPLTPLSVDLSPIHRMMAALGCDDRNEDSSKDEQLQEEHGTPSAPLFTTSTPHDLYCSAVSLHRQLQWQHRRVRRNDNGIGQCTLAGVIDGSCFGADNKRRLTITVFEDDHVDDSTSARNLRIISRDVRQLTVTGHVQEATLKWIINNGRWVACTHVIVEGVQFPTFQLSMLDELRLGLNTIIIRNSEVLREVNASGFENAQRITAFHVTNSSLSAVPDVSSMKALETLNVIQNRVRQVRKGVFMGLTALQRLFLHNNAISHMEPGAFDDLTALDKLILAFNDISIIPSGLFHQLASLTLLQLQVNPITKLDADAFTGLTMLDRLALENALLTSLPPTLFRSTTRLTALGLAHNRLTSLPETIFSGLSSLDLLQLFTNRITSLPGAVFNDLAALTELYIRDNALTALPDNLLAFNTRLIKFYCNNNVLTTVPTSLLANNHELKEVSFANNALRSINSVLTMASSSSLQLLDLSNNPIQELPNATLTPALETLRLQNHEIRRMDLTLLLQTHNLSVLELGAAAQVQSVAVSSNINSTSIAPLTTLRLENVDIGAVIHSLERLPNLNLDTLHIGWPGASELTLAITELCRLFASSVRELRIANAEYQVIHLCPNKTFETVLLNDNRHLRSVIVESPLQELNVSGCTQLTSIDAPPIEILDISHTQVPPKHPLCTQWGRRFLFARNMGGVAGTQEATMMVKNCLEQVDVLDLSGNVWLNSPQEINPVVERTVVLADEEFTFPDFVTLPNRPLPPIFQLTGAPIVCVLQFSSQDLRPRSDPSLLTTEVMFSFSCDCAQGHERSGGVCRGVSLDVTVVAAGSVLGGLFILVPVVLWLYRRYWRSHKSASLHQQLLVERDEEVMALKKAWEIEFDELRMTKRVAAGAFGTVYKAEWDTVTVAVKVLQQAVMAFDESTVLEFEKEVEFLQRTRHPHVVRFFGAGTGPNGSPFLVLEFVAMGSLKDLLGKNMGQVLAEVREDSEGGSDTDPEVMIADVGDELTLVNTPANGGKAASSELTVWGLKLRLLRDVASGMAFIHSLDQMHRDLKSGNVLVSARLRAKITDFGSIRQCFTRGGGSSRTQTAHNRLSSSYDDDPEYSQQAGLQTMTSMTLTAGVGTPLYMAPEALTGDKYSFEADIFSFGVLMWEVATQRVPDLIEQEKGSGYRGPILATLFNLMADGKRLTFEDDEQDAIPEWFQSLTYKCMAQNARERPSFGELKDHHLA